MHRIQIHRVAVIGIEMRNNPLFRRKQAPGITDLGEETLRRKIDDTAEPRPEAATRRKAEGMVQRLAAYLRGAGAPLLVEAPFTLETGRATVRGTADRIEQAPAGPGDPPRVLVVDLKTGSQVTGQQAEMNPQLAAYQLAVDDGAFQGLPEGATSAGAMLLYVGANGAKDGTRKRQAALDEDRTEWAAGLIDGVAETMAASTFRATRNDDCRRCPVRSSCPVQPEGGQVTA